MNGLIGSLVGEVAALANQPAPVILGPLTLSGPEAPSRITIGGAQMAAIHKLPGGARIIDAMGPDDNAVVWRGVFIGPTAASRVRTVDAIRIGGQPCTLAFGDYLFEVLIVDFQYSYESRGAVISYSIRAEKTVTVIPAASITALESAVSDCSLAAQFLTNTRASVAAYGAASAAPVSVLAGMLGSVGAATSSLSQDGSSEGQGQSTLSTCAAAVQTAIPFLSVGSLSGATLPFSVPSGGALLSVMQNAGALAGAVGAGGYVNRATAGLAAAAAQANPIAIHS